VCFMSLRCHAFSRTQGPLCGPRYPSPPWLGRGLPRKAGEVTYGPTPLIAGLRCIVKAELGGKVLVPAELLAEKR